MKETGLNYFYEKADISPDFWRVFYTFEENAGSDILSVSGGLPFYNATLSSVNSFWATPNSGFFSGNVATLSTTTGLNTSFWTQIFVYEKIKEGRANLAQRGTAYSIGVNDANKPYFQAGNSIATSSLAWSDKNALLVSYMPNGVNIGYYDFTTQKVLTEQFLGDFQADTTGSLVLGSGFIGYFDYYAYINDIVSPDSASVLLSGLQFTPTGRSYEVETLCQNTITGYQSILMVETGITGYRSVPSGNEGRDFYSGEFPVQSIIVPMTGIISQSTFESGVTGLSCQEYTGSFVDILHQNTGYASTFGFTKATLVFPSGQSDLTSRGLNLTPSLNIYNLNAQQQGSAFYPQEPATPTGKFNIYQNGLAIYFSGLSFSGDFFTIDNAEIGDIATYDLIDGHKAIYSSTGAFPIAYSGQLIFLFGLKLESGKDFTSNGSEITLTSENALVSGLVFEYPNALPFTTGQQFIWSGERFPRLGNVVFINGLRQKVGYDYFEGCFIDKLGQNRYNYFDETVIYQNTDDFWS